MTNKKNEQERLGPEALYALAELVQRNGTRAMIQALIDACESCADVSENRAIFYYEQAARSFRFACSNARAAERHAEFDLGQGLDVLAGMADEPPAKASGE
jgi:hypothetical protein